MSNVRHVGIELVPRRVYALMMTLNIQQSFKQGNRTLITYHALALIVYCRSIESKNETTRFG